MKKLTMAATVLLSTGLFMSGCAPYSINMRSLLGTNTADLEKAKDRGITRTFDVYYTDAFHRVESILKANGQIIFRSDMEGKLIVAINFPRQTDTTRVGIFFEPVAENKTTITLSSLSSTALEKARDLIFPKLAKAEKSI